MSSAPTKFMKREWCSIEDVYAAYLDCKKRKSKSTSYARFAANEAANIYDLWEDLNNKTYEIGRSDAFCVTRPKVREVFAAQFRDRVVHHLLMLKLLPLFEKAFIEDTYNCRVGKGTDYGINRIAKFMERYPQGWVMKCDIHCFFMNIDKPQLADMLEAFIRKEYKGADIEEVLWLVRMIVEHCPEKNCKRKGDLRLWDILPEGKSLFQNGDKYGMAIGNLTSQIFANYYMSGLDKWLFKIEGICYGRYVDDFILIAGEKDKLLELLPQIREYLRQHLGLELHPQKVYLQPIRHGVKYLGTVIKQGRLYAGNRTVSNAINLVREFNKIKDKERHIEQFAQRYNSYMGYLEHRKSYAIRWKIWNELSDDTKRYVYLTDKMSVLKVRNRYKTINKLKTLYRHGKKYYSYKRVGKDSARVCAQG